MGLRSPLEGNFGELWEDRARGGRGGRGRDLTVVDHDRVGRGLASLEVK